MPPSCALLGGFAIGARVALLWQHNANPSYKLRPSRDMTTYCERSAGSARAAGGRPAGGDEGRSQNCAPYMGSGRGWLTGDWPSTGGVLNITAAAWTAGFKWWRSGDITRTQNASEYMRVLALCLVSNLSRHATQRTSRTAAVVGPYLLDFTISRSNKPASQYYPLAFPTIPTPAVPSPSSFDAEQFGS